MSERSDDTVSLPSEKALGLLCKYRHAWEELGDMRRSYRYDFEAVERTLHVYIAELEHAADTLRRAACLCGSMVILNDEQIAALDAAPSGDPPRITQMPRESRVSPTEGV